MVSKRNSKIIGLFFLIVLSVFACKKSKKDSTDDTSPDVSGFDRKALLTYTADEIIIPSYEKCIVKLDTMKKKSDVFTSNPTLTNLSDFRQSWVEAYTEWQKIELFDFGPAYNHALRSYINIYPANQSGISSNITNTSANMEVPNSYPTQGFPALDYLLNGVASNDNDIITYYTNTDGAARLAYVKKLTDLITSRVATVYADWKTGGYRQEFIDRSGMDLSSSLPLLVNGYVLNYERYIRSGKFGLPAGAMTGGSPSPLLVEALYKKDISRTLATTAQAASIGLFNGKSVLTGTEGASLKTYLDAVKAQDGNTGGVLTSVINNQFNTTNTKLALLNENFNQEVQTNNQKMVDVFTEMQKTVRLLKVDMTSALSITITYVDNDGD